MFPVPEICEVYSATPSMKLDAEGIDVLVVLKTGVAIPIQIKSGLCTIGIVLPLSEEREKWPKRLAIVSRRMERRLLQHFRKHPSIKCMLFVNRPRGFDDDDLKKLFKRVKENPNEPIPEQVISAMKEISEEVRTLVLIAAKNTCYNLFYRNKDREHPQNRQ